MVSRVGGLVPVVGFSLFGHSTKHARFRAILESPPRWDRRRGPFQPSGNAGRPRSGAGGAWGYWTSALSWRGTRSRLRGTGGRGQVFNASMCRNKAGWWSVYGYRCYQRNLLLPPCSRESGATQTWLVVVRSGVGNTLRLSSESSGMCIWSRGLGAEPGGDCAPRYEDGRGRAT